MKNLIVAVLSLGVLAGAYVVAFGLPAQFGGDVPAENATQQSSGPGGPGGGPPGRGGGATTVVLALLEQSAYTLVLRTVGSAVSLHQADVIATEAGEVVEAALQANSFVEKGDVILRLDELARHELLVAIKDELDGKGLASKIEILRGQS